MRCSGRLRWLQSGHRVWSRGYVGGQPLRAGHLHSAMPIVCGVRPGRRRVRRTDRLWQRLRLRLLVHLKPVRAQQLNVPPANVFGPRCGVRHHQRRVWRDTRLRQLQREPDLRQRQSVPLLDQEIWTIPHRFKSVRAIGAVASADWRQLNDALQINGQGANVTLSASQSRSDILYLHNAGLNIPSDATVLGMEVELSVKRNGTDPFLDYLYVWQSNLQGTPKRGLRLSGIGTGYRTYTYGGESDRWGIAQSSLHPSRVNGTTFGVRLVFEANSFTNGAESRPFVDYGRVRVRYRACR